MGKGLLGLKPSLVPFIGTSTALGDDESSIAYNKKLDALFAELADPRTPIPDTTIFPWSAVANIDFVRGGSRVANASGVLAAADVVLTAKHVFQTIYDRLDVVVGYDGHKGKGWPVKVRGIVVHPLRDVAALLIDQPDIKPMASGYVATQHAILAGYPQGSREQLAGEGGCEVHGHFLVYDVAVKRGDSGAPVFIWNGQSARCVAIHSEKHEGYGYGEILDDTLLRDLNALLGEAKEKVDQGG